MSCLLWRRFAIVWRKGRAGDAIPLVVERGAHGTGLEFLRGWEAHNITSAIMVFVCEADLQSRTQK